MKIFENVGLLDESLLASLQNYKKVKVTKNCLVSKIVSEMLMIFS